MSESTPTDELLDEASASTSLDDPGPDAFRARLEAERVHARRGERRYQMEGFGLDPGAVLEQLSDYVGRHAIAS